MITRVRFESEGLNDAEYAAVRRVAARRLRERAGITEAADGYVFRFVMKESPEGERFTLGPVPGGVCIEGSTMSALLTGFGCVLRDGSLYPGRGFVPGEKYYTHIFPRPFRGMYFATHNNNYYTEAPMDEVRGVIEDLMLWGLNVLCVWFDMYQHPDVGDEDSRRLLRRIRDVFDVCGELGIKTVLTSNANEAFADSPKELRADWRARGDYFRDIRGHYHVEICPSKPGGIEAILEHRERMLKAFRGFNVNYFLTGPYDQGGCTCDRCAPWGANGYLRTVSALRPLIKKYLPDTEIAISAWYFNRFIHNEWEAFYRAFSEGGYAEWVSFIIAFFNTGERVPCFLSDGSGVCGVPLVEFSEISMYGAKPWGGFGANPYPKKIGDLFVRTGGLYGGVLPYSEGKYEDINKCTVLGLYSGLRAAADELVRDYARLEFSPDNTDKIMHLLDMEEDCIVRTRVDDEVPNPGRSCKVRFAIWNNQIQGRMKTVAEEINGLLDAESAGSWRWRIVYLRALIDSELVANNAYVSPACIGYMDELTRIYHAQTANYWVCPPTPQSLVRNGVLDKDDVNG